MYANIREYVKSCHVCQTCKTSNSKEQGQMKISELCLPWEKVSIDLIGPMPKTRNGNDYALVIIDACTGWPEVFPLRQSTATAEGCASRVLSVFTRWNFPHRIISDNGPQFASELWTKVMSKLKVKAIFTTPYHPQANPVERKNKDIKSFLRKYCHENQKTWDEYLDVLLFALRSAKNASTGLTPAMANLGRNLKSPVELFLPDPSFKEPNLTLRDYVSKLDNKIQTSLKFLVENKELAGIEQKLYYDQHHKRIEFNDGDWVTLQAHPLSSKLKGISASLAPKREGPYLILKKMNPLNYELGDVNTKLPITFAHVVQLRKYEKRPNVPILTDKSDGKRISLNPTKAKVGLGKSKGRPIGSTNVKTVTEPILRDDGPVTRQQTKLIKK